MKLQLVYCLAMSLSITAAGAQSLKPQTPAPLQAGINQGTVDNFIGTHYWYFQGGPGKTQVHTTFTPMGVLGGSPRTDLTITLYDEGHTWHTAKTLTSDSKEVDYTFDGDFKTPTKVCISVAPPSGGLVRMGGDYQLEVTGAVSFGQKSNADPVIGTYKQMTGYTALLGDCRFLPDGSIQTTSGSNGRWKLFDPNSQTYVIEIDGQDRHSLQYVPGRGLCDSGSIIFQQM